MSKQDPESTGRPVRRWVILGVIAILIIVPGYGWVTRVAREGSQPRSEALFSFQMYSFANPSHYEGTDAAGAHHEISAKSLPAVERSINYDTTVQQALCKKYPSLVTVRRTGPNAESYTC